MRKSIYSNIEIFRNSYNRICELINKGIKSEELPSKLENEYLPKEIRQLVHDLGQVKIFKKVDKIHIIYRFLSVAVLLQFIINFLFVVFFATLTHGAQNSDIDLAFFSMPLFLSIVGIILSILLVINSVWENPYSTLLVLLSFFFFSQVYNNAFVIFKPTSTFYWIPVLIFIATFLLTIRLALPRRERLISLIKKLNKIGVDRSTIPDALSSKSIDLGQKAFFYSFSKPPNSKILFGGLPYKVKKNPTKEDLINLVNKKKRYNNVFLAVMSLYFLGTITLIVFSPEKKYSVYEMIQFIFFIGFFIYLFLRKKSLNVIDDRYLLNAINEIKASN